MKKACFILIFTISSFTNVNCQHDYKFEYLDPITKSYANRLKDSSIDTFLIYKMNCLGGLNVQFIYQDTCENLGFPPEIYCVWKKNAVSYITRIEESPCYKYSSIEYGFDSIWNFIFSNMEKLKYEEIKLFSSSAGNQTSRSYLEDDCFKEILIVIKNDTIAYDLYDYLFEKCNKDHDNLNFEYNWSTEKKKLQLLTQEIISTINDDMLREKLFKYYSK